MVSIIIAAHNEESVLGDTLDALLSEADGCEIVVAANGCSDDTAHVARSRTGVTVVELMEGGKAGALNAADDVASSFPRIYLDADILVPPDGITRVLAALQRPGILVAVPGRRLDLTGRPWPVRAWTRIHERLPVFNEGLFGRGMIALSAAGRARFGAFPLMVADDLFLDSLFSADEKAHVEEVVVMVDTPATTRALMNRLVRVRRGSAAMRHAGNDGQIAATIRPSDPWSWLRDVVAQQPRLAPAGLVYATLTLLAEVRARRGPLSDMSWGRDDAPRTRIGG